MISRKELLEAMAQAIRCVDLYDQNDGHEYLEGSQKIAEAALDALLDKLPKVKFETMPNKTKAAWYEQLLSLRRE